MSKTFQSKNGDVLNISNPLEALQASSEFQGPVEPLDGDTCNDHFAQVYETWDEQIDAAVPFLRQGLERNEHCIYVVDEDDGAELREEMRDAGIDVDDAVASNQLRFETVQDTYLRNGSFDPDEMIEFYADAIDAATDDWAALRVIADTTWLQHTETSIADFMEYESKINDLFGDEDCIALCQYDRTEFSEEVVRDIVQTHPHLISEGTVCHNFYYTPPREFFAPAQPSFEVDRMLGTLRERTEAKAELQERERYLERHNEITSDPEKSFEEKLQALFQLGCERFDLDLGAMARVDIDDDWFEVEWVSDDHAHFEPGVELPLSETYCTAATEIRSAGSVSNPAAEGYDDIFVYQEFGIRAYLGTYIGVEGGIDRTFFFIGSDERDEGFTDDERAFLQSMGQWVKYELEQHQRERELERTVERLETSNERLEQFAYAASHDLQEPLRMVSSYLQLIEHRADDELSEESREFLDFAVDGADRMRDMIEGLLAYSRIEMRGEPLDPIELDNVLEDVREDLQFQFDESDAELRTASLPRVAGDGNQLRQLFQNLLSNAIKYSGESPPRIEITAEQECDEWVISIRDEGIGIEPDQRERVFDIFDRLHSREEYDGTGIGLALCERIVERHGGEIWVESEPGEGSTFSFSLPVTR